MNLIKTVLFVDDEPSIRLTLPAILEEHGFKIRVADSVASAIKEISNHKFDVLLSDLNIGEPRDGFSVVKAARAANPRCVAILLTGYPDFDSERESIKKEVDGYLVKPADIEVLVRTIEEKLAAKAAVERSRAAPVTPTET
jgi:DNA-binding NtrC family response regulator